jgi:hypothetical protein
LKPVPPVVLRPSADGLAVKAEPAAAGARPARLSLALQAELQCGRLVSGPIFVVLPAAERLPERIAPSAVLVSGGAVAGVSVSGHTVAIALRKTIGLMCDSITHGTVTIVFAKAARLGNPLRAGSYSVAVRAGSSAATGRLIVS